MMPSLARSIILHEWRRFWAAALALGFSAFLIFMQSGLALGSWFLTESSFLMNTGADLWVANADGYRSLVAHNEINRHYEFDMRMHPEVVSFQTFWWNNAQCKTETDSSKRAWLIPYDVNNNYLSASDTFRRDLGHRLEEPLSVVFDRNAAKILGLKEGDSLELNNKQVKVVGFSDDYGGGKLLFAFVSQSTFDYINPNKNPDRFDYLLLKVKDKSRRAVVAQELNRMNPEEPKFIVMTPEDMYWRSLSFWIYGTDGSKIWIFLVLLALVIAAEIVNASLRSAILSEIKEYAALRALGVSGCLLYEVVIKQALMIAVPGLLIGIGLTCGFAAYARHAEMAFYLPFWYGVPVVGLILCASLISGLLAIRTLYHTEPAELLR